MKISLIDDGILETIQNALNYNYKTLTDLPIPVSRDELASLEEIKSDGKTTTMASFLCKKCGETISHPYSTWNSSLVTCPECGQKHTFRYCYDYRCAIGFKIKIKGKQYEAFAEAQMSPNEDKLCVREVYIYEVGGYDRHGWYYEDGWKTTTRAMCSNGQWRSYALFLYSPDNTEFEVSKLAPGKLPAANTLWDNTYGSRINSIFLTINSVYAEKKKVAKALGPASKRKPTWFRITAFRH